MSRLGERRSDLLALTGRRVAAAPLVLAAITAATFALAAASPMDPLRTYMGEGINHATAAQRQAAAAAMGLDVPWWRAWWGWVSGLLHGDAGWSHLYRQPVAEVIAGRLPATMLLSAVGLAGAAIVALLAARAAARRPGGLADRAIAGVAVVLSAVPSFVVAVVVIGVFAVALGWLPPAGITTPGASPTVAGTVWHLVAPAAVLAASQVPWMVLAVRQETHAVGRSPAVLAARMRGLDERVVRRGHIYPLSLLPLAALVGTRLPELIAGALVVEAVFAWPGLAAATVDAAVGMDFALLAAVTAGAAGAMLAGSWLADCVLLVADPRVCADG